MLRFGWWRDPNNRDGAKAIVEVLKFVLPAGGTALVAVAVWFGFLKPQSDDAGPSAPTIQTGDNSPVNTGSGDQNIFNDVGQVIVADPEKVTAAAPAEPVITMTLAQYETQQNALQQRITSELTQASEAERSLLESQLAEVTARLENLPDAYAEALEQVAALERRLAELQGEVSDADLIAAQEALRKGQTAKADALFAQVEEQADVALAQAASAAFARGQIAEEEIRWADAAQHYEKAARLQPSYANLVKAGNMLWRAGAYRAAIQANGELVEVAKEEFGPNAPEVAVALANYALSLQAVGRYDEAESAFREGLALTGEIFGTDSADYAVDLSNLGNLLIETGQVEAAAVLLGQAHDITLATLGEDHPQYAVQLGNFASALDLLGDHAAAEPLYRKGMTLTGKAVGKDHPDYATDLSNLGTILQKKGDTEQAEQYLREALQIRERTLGPAHPDTANSQSNLAALLIGTDRSAEALPLARSAAETMRTTRGETHPDYAVALNNVARAELENGDLDGAEASYEAALRILTFSVGPDDPRTLHLKKNIAALEAKRASE